MVRCLSHRIWSCTYPREPRHPRYTTCSQQKQIPSPHVYRKAFTRYLYDACATTVYAILYSILVSIILLYNFLSHKDHNYPDTKYGLFTLFWSFVILLF
jgi:thiaminase